MNGIVPLSEGEEGVTFHIQFSVSLISLPNIDDQQLHEVMRLRVAELRREHAWTSGKLG